MTLRYPPDWRFALPEDTKPVSGRLVTAVHQQLVKLTGPAEDRHDLLEQFKEEFASAAGLSPSTSTSYDWAVGDLRNLMVTAASNAATFIDAYWSSLERARAAKLPCPTLQMVNKLLAAEDSPFEIRPPDLVERKSAPVAEPEPVPEVRSSGFDYFGLLEASLPDPLTDSEPRFKAMPAPTAAPPVPNPTTRRTYDIAIVCALHAKELESVLSIGTSPWSPLHLSGDPTTYHETAFARGGRRPLRVVAAAAPHMGMQAAAVLTTKMILSFSPKLVAMTGIAAGSDPEQQGFGDILIPDTTFDYGAGKLISEKGELKLRPDARPLAIDASLGARLHEWKRERRHLDEIRRAWRNDPPKTALDMHLGPFGSGSAVLDTLEPLTAVLTHWRKLIGVDMEAHAVHLACHYACTPRPSFLCMKSICDFAADKADTWQRYAAFTAAELFYRFVTEEWETLALSSPQKESAAT